MLSAGTALANLPSLKSSLRINNSMATQLLDPAAIDHKMSVFRQVSVSMKQTERQLTIINNNTKTYKNFGQVKDESTLKKTPLWYQTLKLYHGGPVRR